ncbi:hypothetical protein JMJ77_0002079 [Colletotrichum scovillei]|uniref:Uncharacterized protein n=1 Tax=Colletotrichum scovillei TaxID=1209932 RepID=A0A9P7R8W6_9PEZI|nr:hypothetical protein JMJ77_0002079 [Colletotrichum scovillei]KAG7070494.1 hypothetical protein JMJ76_0001745 [Colletotrichum scovillei]KAG7078743.1 hypothetical protein JMJ78_0002410 [Colletotrichum scovillei]
MLDGTKKHISKVAYKEFHRAYQGAVRRCQLISHTAFLQGIIPSAIRIQSHVCKSQEQSASVSQIKT